MNESDPCRCRKSMASPPSPQPKQWKWPRLESTVTDGVFSWWNGHRPFMRVPPAGHVLADQDGDVGRRAHLGDRLVTNTAGHGCPPPRRAAGACCSNVSGLTGPGP